MGTGRKPDDVGKRVRSAKRYTLKRLLRRPVVIEAGAKVTAEHDDGQLVVRIEPAEVDKSPPPAIR